MTTDQTMTPTAEDTAAVDMQPASDVSEELAVTSAPTDDAAPTVATETTFSGQAEAAPESAPVVEQGNTPEPTPEAEPTAPVEAVDTANTPEPVVPAAPEPPVAAEPVVAETTSAADDMALFEAAVNAFSGDESTDTSFQKLRKGDRVEATVIQVERDKVFVDLGTKAEGILPIGEITEQFIESASDHVKVGDRIQVVVIRPESSEGSAIVSKKRADFEEIWDSIEQHFRSGEMVQAQVIDRVKGGLVVDLGVRGFVPATHVGNGKLRNIEKYVGQALSLKILEIDRERKKVVLSNREAEELRRSQAKEDIFKNVAPGEILEGTVRRLTDYGAFVDLGGVDGLLHISEMSWMRITHPKEMFKEGQKIKVMVLRLDPSNSKISLGHRQVLPDPWNLIKENYRIGTKITCTIGRLVQSGAFVRLPEGAEAFLPLSEMSSRRVRRPEEVVDENQEVEVQIIDLRPDERRMVLSMRALGGGDAPRSSSAPVADFEDDRGGKRGGPVGGGKGAKKKKGGRGGRDDDFEDYDDFGGGRRTLGTAGAGATIGERLGALKGFLNRDDDDAEETEAEPQEEATTEEA